LPRARSNGIELEYEIRGDDAGRPLLLIMGLGCQMIHWDEEFCDLLAERGHRVIRYDNRDTGRSTWLTEAGVPDLARAMERQVEAPYLIDDMADDAAGLLEALGVESAHVVGASMGGMIAQGLALRHRTRVRTLTSIMSTTGRPDLPMGRPEAMARLLLPAPSEREAVVEHNLETARMLAGSAHPLDEERHRARTRRAFDRGFNPAGSARHVAAIAASPSRHELLAGLDVPALVIHGADDPLVHPACGLDTHRCLAGSEWLPIEGMGHDLPAGVWPTVAAAITGLTGRGEDAASAA
jgi:pimeloyl-ACP methyl ester carboxylesterase